MRSPAMSAGRWIRPIGAALAAEGELGQRIRADLSHELLVTDLDIYRPALEK